MGTPARMLASAAAVVLAAGVGVAGLIWAAPDRPRRDSGETTVAVASPSLAVAKAAPEQPAEPTLHGAAPVFKPTQRELAGAEVDPAKAIVRSSPADAPRAPPARPRPPARSRPPALPPPPRSRARSTAPRLGRGRSRSPATSPPPSSATRPAPATRPCARHSARRRPRRWPKRCCGGHRGCRPTSRCRKRRSSTSCRRPRAATSTRSASRCCGSG